MNAMDDQTVLLIVTEFVTLEPDSSISVEGWRYQDDNRIKNAYSYAIVG